MVATFGAFIAKTIGCSRILREGAEFLGLAASYAPLAWHL